MPAIIILALIVVAAVVIVKSRSKPTVPPAPVMPSASTPVHIPPVNSPEKVSRRDDAVRVYLFEENPQGWCCPNCQCENDSRRTNCCVCNYKRG